MSDIKLKDCDLIMKGGITSGVVYPALISELCGKYRFRCIGGTSAGAIAAALAAAAEVGRSSGGFDKFSRIAEELRTDDFLLNLFQPGKESKPLMDLGLKMLKQKKGVRKRVIAVLTIAAVAWLLLAIGFSILLWRLHPSAFPSVAQAALCALLAALMAAGVVSLYAFFQIFRLGWIVLKVLPKQGFGLCLGRRDPRLKQYQGKEVLTDWLAGKLKECAGKPELSRPLTFADLWDPGALCSERGATSKQVPVDRRSVDLQIFTSNLSQGQPYVFPLQSDDLFIFKEEEFREYFGDEVVQHMIETSPRDNRGWTLPNGFHVFPPPEDFPVVVATRMSLSFPVLFRAVPVYTVMADAHEGDQVREEQLQKNWFSDGGICSNFPIHIFDAWLPSRPTFGVNLTSFAPDVRARDTDEDTSKVPASALVRLKVQSRELPATPQQAVFIPKADQAPWPQFSHIKDLPGFFTSILVTAKDCHDQLQSMLPGYRERIVQIRLEEGEGGLNLSMPKDTIEKVIQKGKKAGSLLADDFDFESHQWVRMRVLLLQLAMSLKDVQQVLAEGSFNLDELFKNQSEFPFHLNTGDAEAFHQSVDALHNLVDKWLLTARDEDESLKPYPALRVVPPKM